MTTSFQEPFALEVIVCSIADAVAAYEGGADRLEIVRNLDAGGLTPSVDVVGEILATVPLPARVMVRETDSFNIAGESERAALCGAAHQFAKLGAHGLVCGFLKGPFVDHALLGEILRSAPDLKVTFHRAFEEVGDPVSSIGVLKRFGAVDRILTSGGSGGWAQKLDYFNTCVEAARPEISLIAGGGLDESSIQLLRDNTLVREFHVGRSVRIGGTPDGPVDSGLVRRLKQVLTRHQ